MELGAPTVTGSIIEEMPVRWPVNAPRILNTVGGNEDTDTPGVEDNKTLADWLEASELGSA